MYDVGVIIQARMASTRCPGKVLMPVLDRPMLYWVWQRAQAARKVDHVIVATSRSPADDAIEAFCRNEGIPCFRGSEHDVLDRYVSAARQTGISSIIRVTGDCPLTDPQLLDELVDAFESSDSAYVSNSSPLKLPHGLEASIGSLAAYEQSWREANLKSEREHVTLYIRKHPELFATEALLYEPDWSHYRLTVDYPEDLEVIRRLFSLLRERGLFGHYKEVVSLLEEFPAIAQINSHFCIAEGLAKSLREDGTVTPDASEGQD